MSGVDIFDGGQTHWVNSGVKFVHCFWNFGVCKIWHQRWNLVILVPKALQLLKQNDTSFSLHSYTWQVL